MEAVGADAAVGAAAGPYCSARTATERAS